MCIESLDSWCSLVGTLERQLPMPYARELTYRSEDWNTQPCRPHLINGYNISKTSNKYPEAILDDENWLYEFEDVYSIDQTFYVRPIVGKSEVV